MKKIILGPPLTGKSTLAQELHGQVQAPVLDFDDELLKRNNNQWPGNDPELNERLRAEVEQDILGRDDIIFMAFELSLDGLRKARNNGFIIYQLTAVRGVLEERNQQRLATDPTNDAFDYIDTNLAYQKSVKEAGLVDLELDATSPIEDLVKQVLTET